MLQGWGLTEAAPACAAQRLWPRRFRYTNYYERHLGSVGSAIPGVEIALIDVPEKEIYVHLHGEDQQLALQGIHNGVRYVFCAADAVDFTPVKIQLTNTT